MATLNRFALQKGNFDCSRYGHTRASCWSCNRSYSTSKATERQASAEVAWAHPGSWTLTLVPTRCLSSQEQKLVRTLLMPFSTTTNRSTLLLLTQGTVWNALKAFCFLLCFLYYFLPYCTFTKFWLNCSITWGELRFRNNHLSPEHWL